MDSLTKNKVIRTYSRLGKRSRPADDFDESTKRRLVDDDTAIIKPTLPRFSTMSAWLAPRSSSPSMPSTPGLCSIDTPIFSDEPDPCTSPPSSPPPSRDPQRVTLAPVAGNIMTPLSRKPRVPTLPLVQMQINLGSALQKTCKECGMAYVKSDSADSALHDKYHRRHLEGPDLGKPFRKFADNRAIWRNGDETVVVLDGKDRGFERSKAREVLDIAQAELGAVDIPDADLWMTLEEHRSSRYRMFLYLAGTRCVGLCLAKSIHKAHRTLSNSTPEDISIAEQQSEARIGISRVWVSKSYRRKGVARTLLDNVSQSFDPAGQIGKDRIAFSQPTTSGAKLARRWFGQESGWQVYID